MSVVGKIITDIDPVSYAALRVFTFVTTSLFVYLNHTKLRYERKSKRVVRYLERLPCSVLPCLSLYLLPLEMHEKEYHETELNVFGVGSHLNGILGL